MAFVLRTDKLSRAHYFAGAMDGAMSPNPVITSVIFNAWGMETKEEAEKVQSMLGRDDWSISEVSDVGFSQNLDPQLVDQFLHEDDEGAGSQPAELDPAMEVYDVLLDVCEENDLDPTQQMHVLQSVNFTFITELFSREGWHTALDRMTADLHRLMDEFPKSN